MILSRLVRLAAACLGAAVLTTAAWAAADGAAAWAALTPAQRQVLAPLQRDWPTLDANRRQKWLEMATRFPGMSADERQRVQERMAEWARLTPAQRTAARMQFQEVRQIPADERHAKWQAYQALPEAERQSLASRAKPPAKTASANEAPGKGKQPEVTTAKSGASAPGGRAVAPIVVQARPGATTTTMSTRSPPPHATPPGAPKIAATSHYVDPATLLPRRQLPGASHPASVPEGGEQ